MWSEHQPIDVGRAYFHTFPLFKLSVCGVNLLSNFSSNYQVLVDTGTSCLGLPATFYDQLFKWIAPAVVYSTGDPSSGAFVRRYGTKNEKFLPTITFRLSEHGPLFRINLNDLLLEPYEGPIMGQLRSKNLHYLPICVYKLPPNSLDAPGASSETHPRSLYFQNIVLGSMALTAMRTTITIDMAQARIGLVHDPDADDHATTMGSDGVCSPPQQCVGGQSYFAASNVCEDPDCGKYLLRELDENTMTCVTSRTAYIICAALLAVLLAIEIYTEYQRGIVARKLRAYRKRQRSD